MYKLYAYAYFTACLTQECITRRSSKTTFSPTDEINIRHYDSPARRIRISCSPCRLSRPVVFTRKTRSQTTSNNAYVLANNEGQCRRPKVPRRPSVQRVHQCSARSGLHRSRPDRTEPDHGPVFLVFVYRMPYNTFGNFIPNCDSLGHYSFMYTIYTIYSIQ